MKKRHKMKRNSGKMISICIMMLCIMGVFRLNAGASDTVAMSTVAVLSGEEEKILFETASPGIIAVEIGLNFWDASVMDGTDSVRAILKNSSGTVLADDYLKIPAGADVTDLKSDCAVFYSENILPPGEYSYTFRNEGAHDYSLLYEVIRYPSKAASISIKPTVKMKTEEYKLLKYSAVPSSAYPEFERIYSSNKSVAEVTSYDRREIEIYAKKAGTCTIYYKLKNGNTVSTKVTVANPAPKLQYRRLTMNVGDTIQNTLKFANGKVKWSGSNKKVAAVTGTGKIKAKKIGKCTITAAAGKKKYKCTVEVVRKIPDFIAYIDSYNKKSHCFTVKIENKGNAELTIRSDDAKVKKTGSKSSGKALKVSAVTIKPGKTKTLKFKVKGSAKGYNYKKVEIIYKFRYDGKTYEGNMCSDLDESAYRSGNNYYYTYSSEEE